VPQSSSLTQDQNEASESNGGMFSKFSAHLIVNDSTKRRAHFKKKKKSNHCCTPHFVIKTTKKEYRPFKIKIEDNETSFSTKTQGNNSRTSNLASGSWKRLSKGGKLQP
jgi:hypothetical protein